MMAHPDRVARWRFDAGNSELAQVLPGVAIFAMLWSPQMPRITRALVASLALGAFFGCGRAAPEMGDPGSGTAGDAVINAAAAATLWVAAGGCKLQGCPYGSYCNEKTGYCDTRKCSEGCPPMTVCNEGLDRCQQPPIAKTPTDRLPQDDKIANPPGQH